MSESNWSDWYGGSMDVYAVPVKAGDTIELKIPGVGTVTKTVEDNGHIAAPPFVYIEGQKVYFKDRSNGYPLGGAHDWKFRILHPYTLPTKPGLYAVYGSTSGEVYRRDPIGSRLFTLYNGLWSEEGRPENKSAKVVGEITAMGWALKRVVFEEDDK